MEFFISRARNLFALEINGVAHDELFETENDAADFAIRLAQTNNSLYTIFYPL
jgi:hypothetical protein